MTSHGRNSVYLVSVHLFERLMELEDADLIVRAQAAIDGGLLSTADSLTFLKGLQHAKPAALKRSSKKPERPPGKKR
ncbi:hypothetical protein [Rudaea sp.]|uniref:hypothetical protein n=1 Tax=Rudaea sp. TaxID=2136325 RepID=UPI0039C989C4